MATTRRTFIKQLGVTSLAVAAPSLVSALPAATSAPAASTVPTGGDLVGVSLKLNGTPHALQVEPRAVLLDVLRDNLGLTGSKKGCDHGQCGACTVLVNGRRTLSCLSLAAMHDGDEITTIEGLEHDGELHPMQAAFLEHDAFQCGYCTSGQIMSAVALSREPVGRDDASLREAMSGNLCRCGAYQNILAAIKSVPA
ncbi:MAG TPA: (2Fe-2S)-binding protein [Opitutaceae bacterium]|nr:(2Fe-2S)-binding protein [Opitutaceae bacterium]